MTDSNIMVHETKTTIKGQADKLIRQCNVVVPTAENINDALNAGGALTDLIVKATTQGLKQVISNHLNAGRVTADPVTYSDIIEYNALAEASRANQGAGLAAFREAVSLVCATATAAGLSAKGVELVKKLISNTTALSMASAARKQKVLQLVEATAGALDDDALATYTNAFTNMIDACNQEESEEDDF